MHSSFTQVRCVRNHQDLEGRIHAWRAQAGLLPAMHPDRRKRRYCLWDDSSAAADSFTETLRKQGLKSAFPVN